jgi:hypothetical protein
MKRLALILALLATPALAATDDDHVAARSAALDMAGAWSNDGFRLRDGFWSGSLKAGEAKLVQVNLYAGNQYWFTLGTSDRAKKIAVTVYDENGKVMPGERVPSDPMPGDKSPTRLRAAAGFAPTTSGPYLVKVQLLEGDPCAFALVYSFK